MQITMLLNGYIRVRHSSGLEALFNRDGTGRGGCVHLERDPAVKAAVVAWVKARA